MWQLIKAEIFENRYIVAICCILPILPLSALLWFYPSDVFLSTSESRRLITQAQSSKNLKLSDQELMRSIEDKMIRSTTLTHIALAASILWFGFVYSLLFKKFQKHANRRKMLLPLAIKKLWFLRIVFWMGLQIIGFSCLILVVMTCPRTHNWVFNEDFWYSVFSINGIALCVIPTCLIAYNSAKKYASNHKIQFSIAVLLFGILMSIWGIYVGTHFLSTNIILALHALSIILVFLITYRHPKLQPF